VLTKPIVTGSYTLSATEAANNINVYTGILTGNVTVTYPPVVNFYIISNQCTAGGYTLTVTTGSGATVTVAANTQVSVYCDGTNFYNANTSTISASVISLPSGSAGSPGLYFTSETNTGIYRPAASQFGISIAGTLISNTTASGISITGTGIFSGGVSGGPF
jgi:hypothetical protein